MLHFHLRHCMYKSALNQVMNINVFNNKNKCDILEIERENDLVNNYYLEETLMLSAILNQEKI